MCSGGGSGTGSIASEYMGMQNRCYCSRWRERRSREPLDLSLLQTGQMDAVYISDMLYYYSTLHSEETEVERTSCLTLQSKKCVDCVWVGYSV